MRSAMRALVAALILFAPPAAAEQGIASIYGTRRDGHAGKCVAVQKPPVMRRGLRRPGGCALLDPRALTAAHRTLPFGTIVTVTNRRNGRQAAVTINDRGPFRRGRIIDLTPAAAGELGFDDDGDGLAPVTISQP
jgi:rare lipoprotein A